MTNLDQLLTLRSFQEGQLRTARRFVPTDFLEPEHFAIKLHRAFEIVDAVASVQELCGQTHGGRIDGGQTQAKPQIFGTASRGIRSPFNLATASDHPVQSGLKLWQ